MKWNKFLIKIIQTSLKEDIGRGDITSKVTIPKSKFAEGIILSKSDGILCGVEVAKNVFKLLDNKINIEIYLKDGSIIKSGDIIAKVYGSARSILSAERTALNFMQRLSGISSLTNLFLSEIKHTKAKILDTRKTAPCLRYFDKYAVKIGGGSNHRFGLFDMFLIKDNHIAVSGSITNAVLSCKNYMKKFNKKFLIEVETKNIDEVKESLLNKVDIIMLDNFSLDEIKKAVDLIDGKCKIEVSGGITLENVRRIAETGVDFISVGALTHSVKALDISLDIRMS